MIDLGLPGKIRWSNSFPKKHFCKVGVDTFKKNKKWLTQKKSTKCVTKLSLKICYLRRPGFSLCSYYDYFGFLFLRVKLNALHFNFPTICFQVANISEKCLFTLIISIPHSGFYQWNNCC